MRALSSELARADLVSPGVAGLSRGVFGDGGSCIAGAGEPAACADVARVDLPTPDVARLQHQRVWRGEGLDGRALGS